MAEKRRRKVPARRIVAAAIFMAIAAIPTRGIAKNVARGELPQAYSKFMESSPPKARADIRSTIKLAEAALPKELDKIPLTEKAYQDLLKKYNALGEACLEASRSRQSTLSEKTKQQLKEAGLAFNPGELKGVGLWNALKEIRDPVNEQFHNLRGMREKGELKGMPLNVLSEVALESKFQQKSREYNALGEARIEASKGPLRTLSKETSKQLRDAGITLDMKQVKEIGLYNVLKKLSVSVNEEFHKFRLERERRKHGTKKGIGPQSRIKRHAPRSHSFASRTGGAQRPQRRPQAVARSKLPTRKRRA